MLTEPFLQLSKGRRALDREIENQPERVGVQTNKYDHSVLVRQRGGRYVCVYVCGERTKQTAEVCSSSLNLQSATVVMGHLLIGQSSKLLLRNGKKKCSANVLGGKHVPFSQWARASLPPVLHAQCSLSFLKHLASTSPLSKHLFFT